MKRISTLDMEKDDIDVLYNIEENFLEKQKIEWLYREIKKLDASTREIFYLKLFIFCQIYVIIIFRRVKNRS